MGILFGVDLLSSGKRHVHINSEMVPDDVCPVAVAGANHHKVVTPTGKV